MRALPTNPAKTHLESRLKISARVLPEFPFIIVPENVPENQLKISPKTLEAILSGTLQKNPLRIPSRILRIGLFKEPSKIFFQGVFKKKSQVHQIFTSLLSEMLQESLQKYCKVLFWRLQPKVFQKLVLWIFLLIKRSVQESLERKKSFKNFSRTFTMSSVRVYLQELFQNSFRYSGWNNFWNPPSSSFRDFSVDSLRNLTEIPTAIPLRIVSESHPGIFQEI